MTQLTLPLPLPTAITGAHLAMRSFALRYRGCTLLDKRKTPRGRCDTVLTDHEVELVRQVYEMGGISLREIAEKFEVSKSSIHAIVTFSRRPYA